MQIIELLRNAKRLFESPEMRNVNCSEFVSLSIVEHETNGGKLEEEWRKIA